MQYQNKSFSVAMGTTKEYRDNWDKIFGKKEEPICFCDNCNKPIYMGDGEYLAEDGTVYCFKCVSKFFKDGE